MKDSSLFYLIKSDYATLTLLTELASTWEIPCDWMLAADDAPTAILFIDYLTQNDARRVVRRLLAVVGTEMALEVENEHVSRISRVKEQGDVLGIWELAPTGSKAADFHDFEHSYSIRKFCAA